MGWRDWFGGGGATSTEDLAREAATLREPAPADVDAQIRALVEAGEKIEAIKVYRQEYGVGLVEAKDAIDAVSRGEPSPAPASATAADSDVAVLVAQGQWIDAIKLYRDKHDVGLAEAKAAVDAMPRD